MDAVGSVVGSDVELVDVPLIKTSDFSNFFWSPEDLRPCHRSGDIHEVRGLRNHCVDDPLRNQHGWCTTFVLHNRYLNSISRNFKSEETHRKSQDEMNSNERKIVKFHCCSLVGCSNRLQKIPSALYESEHIVNPQSVRTKKRNVGLAIPKTGNPRRRENIHLTFTRRE